MAEWGSEDDEGDDEDDNNNTKKGLPEKKKKKLLDPKTWERDDRLVEVANKLRKELGGDLFAALDHRGTCRESAFGSRIAEVHNGSSLFTGDAGQGESNIRRWFIENDWLEAIVALPLNLFYNTGIATYIWVLSNKKPEHRKGKVQLIDATQWFKPLPHRAEDHNIFRDRVDAALRKAALKLPAADLKLILKAVSWRVETAPPVIAKVHKPGKTKADPLRSLFETKVEGKPAVVEYDPDSEPVPTLS